MRRIPFVLALALALASCGDGGPGPSEIPSIGGSYGGIIAPDFVEDAEVFPGSQITVRQSGRNVTITGQFGNSANFDAVGLVDSAGVFTGSGGVAAAMASSILASCGAATTTVLTVRFAGNREAEWNETATTENCDTRRYTGTLERR